MIKVMKEEIFGPVLPVIEYSNFDIVFNIINNLSHHTLACYVFSESKKVQEEPSHQGA
jgi:aldehyde dehydrogenase (NAD+)